jgi:hypothetical protein
MCRASGVSSHQIGSRNLQLLGEPLGFAKLKALAQGAAIARHELLGTQSSLFAVLMQDPEPRYIR